MSVVLLQNLHIYYNTTSDYGRVLIDNFSLFVAPHELEAVPQTLLHGPTELCDYGVDRDFRILLVSTKGCMEVGSARRLTVLYKGTGFI